MKLSCFNERQGRWTVFSESWKGEKWNSLIVKLTSEFLFALLDAWYFLPFVHAFLQGQSDSRQVK